ncbi:MAG TPA: VWA domain-containing protein [Vicinamibacterales bacterium]|jgi:VWFA-related protein
MRAAGAALAIVLLAPWAPAARVQRFRSAADAVRVDALVLDGRRPVGGLTAADFELHDSGVLQQIDDIQIVEVPFSVLLALDTSSSMQPGLPRLRDAAHAVVDALKPDDRAAVLTFSEVVSAPSAWSPSREPVLAAIDRLYADGSTSLADAAFAAMLQRDPEPGRRNLLIVFTDGSDTSSWLPDDSAFDLAAKSDVVVYCVAIDQTKPEARRPMQARSGIRLAWKQPILRSEDFLRELAIRTGGESLSVDIASLQKTFSRIVEDFRSRYVLAYTPRGVPESGWHPIEVQVKDKRYKVTARRGYQR